MTSPTAAPERIPAFTAATVRDRRASLGYLPGLDGIRGVALIGVLLFHAGHLGGGFLSVDLFFVLSGFLITSLLLVEWDRTGTIDLTRFWSRRLRRLLPAALVVLAATALYAAIALDPAELHRFRLDALAALGNVANWRAIEAGSDYWADFGAPSPLRHMWTLSVEEQLYLLWPATTLGGLWLGRRRRWGRQTLLLLTLGLAGASALAMALLVDAGDTSRSYYGTDTRASAVLLGAVAAIGLSGRSWAAGDGVVRGLRTLTPLAMVVLAVAWVRADGQEVDLYRYGFVLCSAAATVLVAAVATRSVPWLVRALEVWPLRELGRISYGAYLWHW
ncbi:MAG TPA: acyltransferase, partial [Acidimicrobiales bacterium]|nr:acyltransferase [Acidimicrobiales bacterium]